jgi:hypothetical protein
MIKEVTIPAPIPIFSDYSSQGAKAGELDPWIYSIEAQYFSPH